MAFVCSVSDMGVNNLEGNSMNNAPKPSKLETYLRAVFRRELPDGKWVPEDEVIAAAHSNILALIEEVIGSDEHIPANHPSYNEGLYRNRLRAEQRLRKDAL